MDAKLVPNTIGDFYLSRNTNQRVAKYLISKPKKIRIVLTAENRVSVCRFNFVPKREAGPFQDDCYRT